MCEREGEGGGAKKAKLGGGLKSVIVMCLIISGRAWTEPFPNICTKGTKKGR